MKPPFTIIYTDLDGTLIDFRDYSFEAVIPVVQRLNESGIPLIFCSSKTQAEQLVYLEALEVKHPFIVENGSAVFIPEGYFSFDDFEGKKVGDLHVVELGLPSSEIRKVIAEGRKETGCEIWGYTDLSIAEIAEITKLDEAAAKRAATRDYTETLLKGDKSSQKFEAFVHFLEERSMRCVSGGKFHTVTGKNSDKGQAVKRLNQLLQRKYGPLQTVGLGDSANDLPLLAAVDFPYLVQKPGPYWQDISLTGLTKVEGVGPEGWVKAVASILK